MKLPLLNVLALPINEGTERVWIVNYPDGTRKKFRRLVTALRSYCIELVDIQAAKNRRCQCGRRDQFCRYVVFEGSPEVARILRNDFMRVCGLRKVTRANRVAAGMLRRIRKGSEYGRRKRARRNKK